jgi:hypothetical protein
MDQKSHEWIRKTMNGSEKERIDQKNNEWLRKTMNGSEKQ